jgi:hypothetical protein
VNIDRLAHLLETEQYRLVPVDELDRLLDRTVRVWTDDLVVDAIRVWADWKGRPPIEEDWRRRRTADEPRRPASSTVARVLGSWDAGLAAAGYPSRRERLVAA